MSSFDTNLGLDTRLGQPRFGVPMHWKDLRQATGASRVWTVVRCPELDGSGAPRALVALTVNLFFLINSSVKINIKKIFNCIN